MTAETVHADIPQLDLRRLTGGDRSELARLRNALGSTGCFLLANCGLAAARLDVPRVQARRFYNLPIEAKEKLAVRPDFTGYVAYKSGRIATSSLNPSPVPDLYEAFLIKRRMISPPSDLADWPMGLPGFREELTNYFLDLESIGMQLLPVIADVLDLAPDYFDPFFASGEFTLRLNCYPALSAPEAGAFRMAPHTDSGFLTFIPSGHVEGLEFLMPETGWRPLPAAPGALLVNTGSILERWSNAMVAASAHRVPAPPSAAARFTTPFFFSPNRDVLIECLPSCATGGPKHAPIRFGDYLDWFMGSNLPDVP